MMSRVKTRLLEAACRVLSVILGLASLRMPDDEQFVRAAYLTLLRRRPDREGMTVHLRSLRRGEMTRSELFASFLRSPEYRQRLGLPPVYLSIDERLHAARTQLVRECLPPAQRIVDLGGAAAHSDAGALLAMGYPHRPLEVIIVDLPHDQRLPGQESFEPSSQVRTESGTLVRYLYGSMADLSSIADGEVDLVFSGESIEHISEEDGDTVCREAFRVLRPGGYFCLDTPNAIVARIRSPEGPIHEEHQKEYRPAELREKVERWGFHTVEMKAICPMPETVRSGTFLPDEIERYMGLGDDPDVGYLFFVKAVKPA